MLEIRDKTFDIRLFKKLIEILDEIYMIQKVSGRDPEYYVDYMGRNAEGYIHNIVIKNKETKTWFSVVVYENQSLKYKGYFRFSIRDENFNIRKNSYFLRKSGFDKWDKKKFGNLWAFAIHLDDLEKVSILIKHYSKYIL